MIKETESEDGQKKCLSILNFECDKIHKCPLENSMIISFRFLKY